jgi:hypothetical protein
MLRVRRPRCGEPPGLDAVGDVAEDDAMSQPQQTATVSITIDLPAALAERIDALNAQLGWDRATFLRLAARAYLTARESDALELPPAAGSEPPEARR